jgi:hypothetical protein
VKAHFGWFGWIQSIKKILGMEIHGDRKDGKLWLSQ